MTATRTAPCLGCEQDIEQREDGPGRWRPLFCLVCELERQEGAARLARFEAPKEPAT